LVRARDWIARLLRRLFVFWRIRFFAERVLAKRSLPSPFRCQRRHSNLAARVCPGWREADPVRNAARHASGSPQAGMIHATMGACEARPPFQREGKPIRLPRVRLLHRGKGQPEAEA
jgi:hypothetical protein